MRNMLNFSVKCLAVSLVLCILTSSKHLVQSASLDEYGHYHLVVAIDEETAQNENLDYVKNIKDSMFDLSELLNYTTDGKFLIQNVDILVPSHWNVEADETSTSQTYEGADVKISHKFYVPQVNNPNACGRPGRDITLPYNFFDSFDSGPYGRLGTALLTLFARLRFGVWEEHGYPGDSSFPYFWKSMLKDEWEVNSCTDKPLNGEYRNIDGSVCGQNSDLLYPPANDCRFFPNENQEAVSSLMSYPYLRNMHQFCDFTTHNREAPTPQNFYCKFKSVKEVIEMSTDFQRVTSSPPTYTPPQIRIIKSEKSKPLLYLLLDRGVTQAPSSILNKISQNMERLITQVELASLTVGVGSFPGKDDAESYSQSVPWTSLQSTATINLINQTLYDTFSTHVGFRNFAAALRDTVLEIKKMQHKAGAAILIVKSGPEANWDALPPEYEVLLPLHDTNIRVHAVEIEGNSIQRGIALEKVCSKSGGEHLKLSSPGLNVDDLLLGYFNRLSTSLQTAFPPKNIQLILKEIVKSGNPVVAVSHGTTAVHAYAIPIIGEVTSGPLLTDTVAVPPFQFGSLPNINFDLAEKLTSWDDPKVNSMNGMYLVESQIYYETRIYAWNNMSYVCAVPDPECQVMFVFFAQATAVDKTYSIQVSTSASATAGVLDLAVETSMNGIGSPFTIYAQIEENGTPLLPTPGLSVIATIHNEARTWLQTLELLDSGPTGPPDMKLNDGIYSGSIIPNINDDTNFKIFVTVKYFLPLPEPTTTTQAPRSVSFVEDENVRKPYQLQNSAGKLFPISQDGYLGCGSSYFGCWSKVPDAEFLASGDLDGFVRIINSTRYKRLAYRIADLRWTPLPDFNVTLEWTAPRTLRKVGRPIGDEEIYSYNARHSDSLDKLIHEFDNCESWFTTLTPKPAGSPELRYWNFFGEAKRYFALKVQRVPDGGEGNQLVESEISNVIAINFQESPKITTTTTSPPATPPSTTTTTTAAPPSTTTANTNVPSTTPPVIRTSVARETTTLLTTPRTTVVTVTTPPPPIITTEKTKQWYQEKNGIIVLSAGGAGLLLIIAGGFALMWFIKSR